MAYIKYEQISLSPTTSGNLSTNSVNTYNGFLQAIRYVATSSATPSTDGTLTVSGERTSITLLNIADLSTAGTNTYFVRPVVVTTTGGTSTGEAMFPLFDERLSITISSGSTGGTKAATLSVFVS